MERKVRVRFAPSPTGPLHIGGVRTALYNYLFAKKHHGDFLLRIEDTDQTRFVPGAENYILESLKWLGIENNEGIGKGGPFTPYKQSERKELYKEYADFLIKTEKAYFAFDTSEELEAIRKTNEAEKKTFIYSSATRMGLKNSLSLPKDEVEALLASDSPYVIRIKIPEGEEVLVNDIIRGEVRVQTSQLDDKVLYKSDGMPTYHLANVVDDYLMDISHVIRGEEWLPSAPLHVLLYRYLGWEEKMPQFAHLPLLLKPEGNGKLSKRDGDRLGFPVFPIQWQDPFTGDISSGYRESGYFSEAVINILAFLGWNPGTEKEIFSLDELIEAFSLDRVSKSGAKFDLEKAKWFNHQYLQTKSDEELALTYLPFLKSKDISIEESKLTTIIGLIKERCSFLSEFWNQLNYFFIDPTEYDEKALKKRWKENTPQIMEQVKAILNSCEPFSAENIENQIKTMVETSGIGFGDVMNPLRLIIVGEGKGPHLPEILFLIGKEACIRRIENGLKNIK